MDQPPSGSNPRDPLPEDGAGSMPPPPPGYRTPPPPPGFGAAAPPCDLRPDSAPAPPAEVPLESPPTAMPAAKAAEAAAPENAPAERPEPTPVRRASPWRAVLGLGCGAFVAALLAGAVFLFFSLQKSPLPAAQSIYVGEWAGADGSTLVIRADGSGDVVSGGTKVTNGQVRIDEARKTLEVAGLFGIARRWRLEEEPTAERRRLVLEGVEFTTEARAAPPADTPGNAPDADSPRDSGPGPLAGIPEAAALAKGSLVAFQAAVESEDFTEFHSGASSNLQTQQTPESIKNAFDIFLKNKALLEPIRSMEPAVRKAGVDPRGVLEIEGEYSSRPPLQFKVNYVRQDGEWKLLGIQLNRKY